MNAIFKLIAAALLAALCGVLCAAAATWIEYNAEADYEPEGVACDGMYFESSFVTSEFEEGVGPVYDCVVTYTDWDAGLNEAEIHLCTKDYVRIMDAIKSGNHFIGALDSIATVKGVTCYRIVELN